MIFRWKTYVCKCRVKHKFMVGGNYEAVVITCFKCRKSIQLSRSEVEKLA